MFIRSNTSSQVPFLWRGFSSQNTVSSSILKPLCFSVAVTAVLCFALYRPRKEPSIVREKEKDEIPWDQFPLKKNEWVFNLNKPEKDLSQFGGSEEVLEYVNDIINYFQNPEKFKRLGATPPKGIILSGPPGVGKTFIAECIAGEAKVPLFLISGSTIAQKYVGQSEEKLRNLFEEVRNKAPCILCIDEIDSIGSKRKESESYNIHSYNSVVNQLLTLLSQDIPGVFVIGTTNHYERLDPALVRPGRFDRHIVLSLPNRADRKKILNIHTQNKKIAPQVSLENLAAISVGFSGAKIATWVNEAVINATKEGCEFVTERHFEAARSILQVGMTRKSQRDPVQKMQTAAHEAGHALIAHLLNRTVYKITIKETGSTEGFTEIIPHHEDRLLTKNDILDQICILLGGRAAESLIGISQAGCQQDLRHAKSLAIEMVNNLAMGTTIIGTTSDIEDILQEQLKRAILLLSTNQDAWEKIRDELVAHDEIFKDEFSQLMKKPQSRRRTFNSKRQYSNTVYFKDLYRPIVSVKSDPYRKYFD